MQFLRPTLHVFDLWAARWRRHEATGDMILMRYADDSAPRRREEEVKHVSTNFSSLAA